MPSRTELSKPEVNIPSSNSNWKNSKDYNKPAWNRRVFCLWI